MKTILLTTILLTAQMGFAKVNCKTANEAVTIDPKKKLVEIVRNGESTKVRIVQANQTAYKLFGDSTYEIEGGYVLGLKAKRLTVFRDGAPVASLNECKNY